MANNSTDRQGHWAATRNLNFVVLVLWFIFALVVPFFATELNSMMSFLGFPFGYYMCVQGSLIAFVVMIWVQNFCQDAIDDKYGVGE